MYSRHTAIIKLIMITIIMIIFMLEGVVSECTNGDIRLVNGSKSNEGRVEYCYNGEWSPMCSLSTYTARLVCKKLGFENYKCKVVI